jgi:polysaccharide deacetylase 2 family uncharacterized protein YibQ
MKQILQILVLGLATLGNIAHASESLLTIIIDDLGNNADHGVEAIHLPGDITYALLPNTPFASVLAELAHEKGGQVILHLPMESEHHGKLGPNGLLENMQEAEYKWNVLSALESVPHVTGLNNHMGSLLTQKEQPMKWLMSVLQEKQLIFLDSRTTTKTVAQQTADAMGVPALRRDVFIDNDRQPVAMQKQLEELIKKSKQQGYATGIAHPYPETLAFLKEQLPLLGEKGVKLVPLSDVVKKRYENLELIELANSNKRNTPCQTSLSHSPRVVKNSKPSP